MASQLFTFMADLANDSGKLEEFKKNPESVMHDYKLTPEQKKQILSMKNDNKQHDMHKAIGDEMHAQFKDGPLVVC